jgi:Tol biopolymer transport system component
MNLSPGTRLGPYEIVSPLGAGGMGEVYRARDTRLGRDVAIKILPAHLSTHPEVRSRFEREAHAVSALSHPHICVLHDVGEQDGVDYLVLELVEGETLAHRLERGPLPLDVLLRTAIQIADALDRAHRSGIVHRDLKPGNVMLSRSGAKLMDFGLARSTGLGPAGGDVTSSPTVSRPLTAEGTIVGTFQYLSPEQLEGKEADARSDLWAFGATVYEMATGKKAFEGKSQASLIAAILERDPPPITGHSPLLPQGLDRLVRACLAKDPEQRLQTAHDAKLQLQWIAEGGSQAGVPAPAAARRRNREALAWSVAAVALAVAAVLGIAQWRGGGSRPAPVVRFQAELPAKVGNAHWPRVSPDGRWIAFVADDSNNVRHIWVRPLDALDAHAVPGTESPGRPFWSPDGTYLGYIAGGKVRRVALGGGPALTMAEAPGAADGSWGKDFILFDGSVNDSLRMVPVGGGDVRPASRIERERGETGNSWPHFLPDGKHFVYMAHTADGSGFIKLGEIGSLESRTLGRTDGRVEYSPPGRLIFIRENTLMAQRFDLGRLEMRGDAVPIGERVSVGLVNGEFSVSRTGVLAYRTGNSNLSRLTWFDRAGHVVDATCPVGAYVDFDLSPDQKQAVVAVFDEAGRSDLWLRDFSRGVLSRLTTNRSVVVWPAWSPSGDRIAYSANPFGRFRTYIMSLTGNGGIDSVGGTDTANEGPSDWSRDGRFMAVERLSPATSWDILVYPLEGDRQPIVVAATRAGERQARISPDGRWIAYSSDETGRREVYLQAFPGPGRKLQVSSRGGSQPAWRGDGRELYFRGPNDALMAVPITAGHLLEVGEPVRLFAAPIVEAQFPQKCYLPSADGRRFLLDVPERAVGEEVFTVVVNWTAAAGSR